MRYMWFGFIFNKGETRFNLHLSILSVLFLILILSLNFSLEIAIADTSAVPGLPCTEDLTENVFRDAKKTNANWSTGEGALILNWRNAEYGVFGPGLIGSHANNKNCIRTSI